MAAKLDIKRELAAVDTRDHDFYNGLSDEEKKAFSPYILMRYTSNANGDRELQEWFLETTNEYVNKHHWTLSKNHKELLWKLFASTGIGSKLYHPYLASSKKTKTDKFEKLLCELYPTKKLDDIKILASMMTKKDREEVFDNMGLDPKQRKEYE
ncbi:MAG: hypothetical protein EBU90_11520 [Proteobacteria bacterium]|nr:hypothetical protein [Pseudomonadota bacterium]NBP14608.1 hypothetical protein [bacterium]